VTGGKRRRRQQGAQLIDGSGDAHADRWQCCRAGSRFRKQCRRVLDGPGQPLHRADTAVGEAAQSVCASIQIAALQIVGTRLSSAGIQHMEETRDIVRLNHDARRRLAALGRLQHHRKDDEQQLAHPTAGTSPQQQ